MVVGLHLPIHTLEFQAVAAITAAVPVRRRLVWPEQQQAQAKRRSATTRTSAMKDPTAIPMMTPVDSCSGLEGSSGFGERIARPRGPDAWDSEAGMR